MLLLLFNWAEEVVDTTTPPYLSKGRKRQEDEVDYWAIERELEEVLMIAI